MRVFLGISCFLDYSWNPTQSSQVKYLILQSIIVNSYFTLSIQINPEKYSSLKLLFALIPSSKTPWNFHFSASGMQVNLGKHVQFVYNTSTVRLSFS